VATITERGCFGRLTTTEVELFRFGCDVLNRGEIGSFVGAIAKGLAVAFAAGTPIVGLALFNGYNEGAIGGSNGFAHNVLL